MTRDGPLSFTPLGSSLPLFGTSKHSNDLQQALLQHYSERLWACSSERVVAVVQQPWPRLSPFCRSICFVRARVGS